MNMATIIEPAFVLVSGEYQEIPISEIVCNGKWLKPYRIPKVYLIRFLLSSTEKVV